jgi:hypothetical protein
MSVRWSVVVVAFAAVLWMRVDEEFFSASAGPLQQRPSTGTAAGGTIAGIVRLNAPKAPDPTRVENTTDPAVCGRSHTLEDLVVSSATKGVAYAIVALEDVPPERTPRTSPGRIVFDNRNCRFVPHAAVVTVGSIAEILNSDPTLHTVHLYGPLDVNIALPLRGMKVMRRLDEPGLVIVKCDVHGWMQAFIRVDPHPFHAVTDTSGAFRMAGIPPGTYTLSVWHEKLGIQKRQVRIQAGQTGRVEFDYSLGGQ